MNNFKFTAVDLNGTPVEFTFSPNQILTGKSLRRAKEFEKSETKAHLRLLRKGWVYCPETTAEDGQWVPPKYVAELGGVTCEAASLDEAYRQQNIFERSQATILKKTMTDHLVATGWTRSGRVHKNSMIVGGKRGNHKYKTIGQHDVWRKRHWARDVSEGECQYYYANLRKAYSLQCQLDSQAA